MIDVLIAGKLYGQPQERTGKTGKTFTTCRVRVPTKDRASVFASRVAFNADACGALLALGGGGAVVVAGKLTSSTYTDKERQPRPGFAVVARQVLAAYCIKRKRDATKHITRMQGEPHQ